MLMKRLLMFDPVTKIPVTLACLNGTKWRCDELQFEFKYSPSELLIDGQNALCSTQYGLYFRQRTRTERTRNPHPHFCFHFDTHVPMPRLTLSVLMSWLIFFTSLLAGILPLARRLAATTYLFLF
jgi:hypothetical protein